MSTRACNNRNVNFNEFLQGLFGAYNALSNNSKNNGFQLFRIVCRLLIAVPLKMYSKFGHPRWILVSQILLASNSV